MSDEVLIDKVKLKEVRSKYWNYLRGKKWEDDEINLVMNTGGSDEFYIGYLSALQDVGKGCAYSLEKYNYVKVKKEVSQDVSGRT